jgi:hypothetical protein
MLTHCVVLDRYLAKQYAPVARQADLAEVPRELIAEKKAPLEVMMEPGDEWWVWVVGTETLMQFGGLALVRAGAVVWASRDWIS